MATSSVARPQLRFDPLLHRYEYDGRELISVTTALREAGLIDDAFWNEEARLRGEYLHRAIALHNEGDLDINALDPKLVPYFTGYEKFLRDTRVAVEYTEKRVFDDAVGYAGTLDLVVAWLSEDKDRVVRRGLVDVKSGSVPPSVGPQTAAYLRLARPMFGPPHIPVYRFALHLPGDHTYRLIPLTDAQDEQTFLAALRVATFRRQHGISR
jgi:hypothetical protein